MPRRALAVLAALLISLAAGAMAGGQVVAAATSPGTAVHVTDSPPTTPPAVTDNPFVPPDKNLSDCVNSNPQPGCGSSSHGGWRQYLTFGIVILGLVFIGWRVVLIVRRNRQEQELESSGRR